MCLGERNYHVPGALYYSQALLILSALLESSTGVLSVPYFAESAIQTMPLAIAETCVTFLERSASGELIWT
jgi:hypothetical protein